MVSARRHGATGKSGAARQSTASHVARENSPHIATKARPLGMPPRIAIQIASAVTA
jgi:hypothetical protein